MSQSAILSFRIPETLKQKLEQRAKADGKNLTEYVRALLAESQAERLTRQAGNELDALQASAEAFSQTVSEHGRSYERNARELAESAEKLSRSVKETRATLDRSETLQTIMISVITGLTIAVALVFAVLIFLK